MKLFVKGCPEQTVLWYRATESRGVSHVCKLKNEPNFVFWLKSSSLLIFDSSEVESSGFISDVWPNWLVPPRERVKPSGTTLPVLQVMLATLSLGLVDPVLFIGKSHALKACFYLINVTIVSLATCLIRVWHLHGQCMTPAWSVYDTCMISVWHLHGQCMAPEWSVYDWCIIYRCPGNDAMFVLCKVTW